MNVLSLFDGISCGMAALERAEIPVEKYSAYEIDKYAITVSEKIIRILNVTGTYFTAISKNTKAVIYSSAVRPAPTGA